jgi:hypothetical protein
MNQAARLCEIILKNDEVDLGDRHSSDSLESLKHYSIFGKVSYF